MAEKDENVADKIKKGLAAPIVFKMKMKSQAPEMKFEKDTQLGIIKWGAKNLLPDSLIKLGKLGSTKHSAILNRKVKMVSGNGWEDPESEKLKEFIANIKGSHNLNDIVKLNGNDYEFLNHIGLKIRWNEDKDFIAAIDFLPAHKIRIGDKKGTFKISDDWKNPGKAESNTHIATEFNRDDLPKNYATLDEDEQEELLSQVIFFKNLQTGTDSYAMPNYAAGMNWILADSAIGEFTLNMIKKNFAGGYHINIPTGIPEDDERKDFKKDFIKQYGGEDGDSIVITFTEPEAEQVGFNALPSTGNENIYHETEKRTSENIMIVHEVTNPQLFAVRVPGELGGKSDLQESLDIFQSVYIDYRQEDIETLYNKLAKINGVEEEMKLKKFSLGDDDVVEGGDGDGETTEMALSKEQLVGIFEVIEKLNTGIVSASQAQVLMTAIAPLFSLDNISKLTANGND